MKSKEKIVTVSAYGENVEVYLRKSRLAKRVIISIKKRQFELVIPKRVSVRNAVDFLHKNSDWVIRKNRELNNTPQIKIDLGTQILILGKQYSIAYSGKLRGLTYIENNTLVVSGLREHIGIKVKRFLIEQAKKEITTCVKIYADKLGVNFGKITLRDTQSRWGSCSHERNLSFSWRLILAPREVMAYVVAHEVVHIKEMSHNKRFWSIVHSLCPNYKECREWLQKSGESLLSYNL